VARGFFCFCHDKKQKEKQMTTISTMRVQERNGVGKGQSRALRLQGMVPGIVYGGGKENVTLGVDPRDILKGMQRRSFYTTIFEFNVKGNNERVLCKAVQLHPVTDQPLHIDFMRVNKDTKVHVGVPIKFINEAECPGIKFGGMLNVVIHNLEVICAAEQIPTELTVNLKGLEVGSSIHLDALSLPAGVVAAHAERDHTIATIVAPTLKKAAEGQAAE
jgi:large subunit ribosomal protein L25